MYSVEIQFEELAKTKPFLQGDIDLSQKELTIHDVPKISRWFDGKKTALFHTINLANNNLHNVEPSHTLDTSNRKNLKGFHLASTYGTIPVQLIQPDPLEALFSKFQNLKKVDLSQNRLNPFQLDCALKGLARNKKLSCLVLDGNILGNYGVKRLIFLLKDCPNLKYLSLNQCGLTSPQLKELSQALADHGNLRQLNLNGNPLETSASETLDVLLTKNQRLTTIIFDEASLGQSRLIDDIHKKLADNQMRRIQLHNSLLDSVSLFKEASQAIEEGDSKWLKVVVGLGFDLSEQEARLKAEETEYLSQKRLNTFKRSVISDQLKEIQTFEPMALLEFKKRQLLQDTLDKIIPSVYEENMRLFKDGLERRNQYEQLDAAQDSEAEEKEEQNADIIAQIEQVKIEKYAASLVPIVEELKIQLHFNTNLPNLENRLQSKKNELEKEAEFLATQSTLRTMRLSRFRERNQDLIDCLNELYNTEALPKYYQREFEDIKGRLLAHNADLTLTDKHGYTLLHQAFIQKQNACLNILLEAGADLLQKGGSKTANSSILEKVIKEGHQSACHNIVIDFVKKKTITEVWPNELQEELIQEMQWLQEMKKVIDDYIEILFKRAESLLLTQIITGTYWHLEERQKECVKHYGFIHSANQFEGASSLLENLNNIIQLATEDGGARRGLLGNSKLHEPLLKLAKQFKTDLEQNWDESTARFEEAKSKKERELIAPFQSQKAEKQIQELQKKSAQTERQLEEIKKENEKTQAILQQILKNQQQQNQQLPRYG